MTGSYLAIAVANHTKDMWRLLSAQEVGFRAEFFVIGMDIMAGIAGEQTGLGEGHISWDSNILRNDINRVHVAAFKDLRVAIFTG